MVTLTEYLKSSGLTQAELARRVDVSKSYMNEIVLGTKTPSLGVALRIQRETANEVPLASLLTKPGDQPTAQAS